MTKKSFHHPARRSVMSLIGRGAASLILSLSLWSASAQAQTATPGFPGEVIQEVIVPVPAEIFLVLEKLGQPDWSAELRKDKWPSFSQRIEIALLLGSIVGEGFIAVEAADNAAVEKIGKDVLRLCESLGLKETVLPHTDSILNAAQNGHWEIVRVELDKVQKTVRDSMEQRRDGELAHCVSLGGWLRGTEAVTHLITKNYTSDSAELLNQPDILKHFDKTLDQLATKNPKLKSLDTGVHEMLSIIGEGVEPPSKEGIQKLHTISQRLVKVILSPAATQ
jgi:hypothetical protein